MSACKWPGNSEIMRQYHDREWCVPSRDEVYLFEMLTLEGAQAGSSPVRTCPFHTLNRISQIGGE